MVSEGIGDCNFPPQNESRLPNPQDVWSQPQEHREFLQILAGAAKETHKHSLQRPFASLLRKEGGES